MDIKPNRIGPGQPVVSKAANPAGSWQPAAAEGNPVPAAPIPAPAGRLQQCEGFLMAVAPVLTRRPSIVKAVDGSMVDLRKLHSTFGKDLLYHGSHSPSLLAFTSVAGDARHSLLPMGEMLKRGITPFCGEAGGTHGVGNAFHVRSINQSRLSAVEAAHFVGAYNYATSVDTKGWTPERQATRLAMLESLSQLCDGSVEDTAFRRSSNDSLRSSDGLPDREAIDHAIRHARGQMATWEQLSPTLQTLVQAHFPIIYGIVLPAGTESERRGFDIPGEVGIPGGASGEMIRHILVPDDFVETTKQHLREHGAPDTIAVHPFSCFRPDDKIS